MMSICMKKFVLAFLFSIQVIYSEMPEEVVLVNIPNLSDWKQISEIINKEQLTMEFIPKDQSEKSWNQLYGMQFIKLPKTRNNLNDLLKRIEETTRAAYPGKQFTWKILESNNNTATYEWSLHEAYKNIPPEHSVWRAFLTPQGFHNVGFTRRHGQMTPAEREKWLKILQTATLVKTKDMGWK